MANTEHNVVIKITGETLKGVGAVKKMHEALQVLSGDYKISLTAQQKWADVVSRAAPTTAGYAEELTGLGKAARGLGSGLDVMSKGLTGVSKSAGGLPGMHDALKAMSGDFKTSLTAQQKWEDTVQKAVPTTAGYANELLGLGKTTKGLGSGLDVMSKGLDKTAQTTKKAAAGVSTAGKATEGTKKKTASLSSAFMKLDKATGSLAWRMPRFRKGLQEFGSTTKQATAGTRSASTGMVQFASSSGRVELSLRGIVAHFKKFTPLAHSTAESSYNVAGGLQKTSFWAGAAQEAVGGFIAGLVGGVVGGFANALFDAAKGFRNYAQDALLAVGRSQELEITALAVGRNMGLTEEAIRGSVAALKDMGITEDAARKTTAKLAQNQIDFAKGLELVTVAQGAAVIAGEDTSQTVDRMIKAISANSVKVLRNIGINVNFQQSYRDLAKEMGVSVDALTENQKMQARVNETIARGAALQGLYKEAMKSPTKVMRSLTGRIIPELGKSIMSVFVPAMGEAVISIYSLTKQLGKMFSTEGSMHGFMVQLGAVANLLAGGFSAAVGKASEKLINFPKVLNTGVVSGLQKLNRDYGVSLQGLISTTQGGMEQLPEIAGNAGSGIRENFEAGVKPLPGLVEGTGIKIQEKFNVHFGNLAARATNWGANTIVSFAGGMVKAIASILTPVLQQLGSFLSWFLAPGSPPNLLPNLDTWGTAVFEEYLIGFTKADFGILSGLQKPVDKALGMLVNAGEISKEIGNELSIGLTQGLTEAINKFSETGKVSEEIFNKIKASTGEFGGTLSKLARTYFNVGAAMKAVQKADGRVVAAQGEQKKVTGELVKEWDKYSAMLAAGASADQLRAQKGQIKAKEEQLAQAKEEASNAKIAKKNAEGQVKLAKEQLGLQKDIFGQLMGVAKKQAALGDIPVAAGKGGKGAMPDLAGATSGATSGTAGGIASALANAIQVGDWGITSKINDEVNSATETLKVRLSAMWEDVIGSSIEPQIAEIGRAFDPVIAPWQNVWGILRTAAESFGEWLVTDMAAALGEGWDDGIKAILGSWGEVGDELRGTVWPRLEALFIDIKDLINEVFGLDFDVGSIGNQWNTVGDAVEEGLGGSLRNILEIVAELVLVLPGVLSEITTYLETIFSLVKEGDWIGLALYLKKTVVTVMKALLLGMVNTLIGVIPGLGVFLEKFLGPDAAKKIVDVVFIIRRVVSAFMMLKFIVVLLGPVLLFVGLLFLRLYKFVYKIVSVIGMLSTYVSFLGTAFTALGEMVTAVIPGVGGAAVSFGAAAGILLIVAGIVYDVMTNLGYYTAKIVNGFQVVIDAIANLGLSGETFKGVFDVIIFVIQKVGMVIGRVFVNLLPSVIAGIISIVGNFIKYIAGMFNMFAGAFKLVWGIITGDLDLATKGVEQILQGFRDVIGGIFGMVAGIITAAFSLIMGVVISLVELITDEPATVLIDFKDKVVEIFMGIVNFVVNLIATLYAEVVGWFFQLYETLVGHSIVTDMLNSMIMYFTQAFLNILMKAGQFVLGVVSWFLQLPLQILANLIQFATDVVNIFGALGNLVIEKVAGLVEGVTGFFTQLKDDLIGHSIVLDITGGTVDAFGEMTTGVESTLRDSWGPIQNAATTAFSGVDLASSGTLLGLQTQMPTFQTTGTDLMGSLSTGFSDVTTMQDSGMQMSEGFIGSFGDSFADEEKALTGTMQDTFETTVGKLPGNLSPSLIKMAKELLTIIAKGLKTATYILKGTFNEVFNDVLAYIYERILPKFVALGEDIATEIALGIELNVDAIKVSLEAALIDAIDFVQSDESGVLDALRSLALWLVTTTADEMAKISIEAAGIMMAIVGQISDAADAVTTSSEVRNTVAGIGEMILQAVAEGIKHPDESKLVSQALVDAIVEAVEEAIGDFLKLIAKKPDPDPGYQQGTSFVPETGLSLIHKGEMVIPALLAQHLRRTGMTMASLWRASADREVVSSRMPGLGGNQYAYGGKGGATFHIETLNVKSDSADDLVGQLQELTYRTG